MSINNIQLTPFLLQELYSNSLVEILSQESELSTLSPASFSFLGNNRKKIIILVANDETLYLPDDQLNFLMGILSACSLTMEHVAIINIKKNKNVTYKTIEQELKAVQIILLGVTPAQISLPVEFPKYQVQPFNNQTYLSATGLFDIQDNKAEKGKLWNCLKQLFSI